MKTFRVIGLMSGTSLDGVDIAYCVFHLPKADEKWRYKIIKAKTVPYNRRWHQRLKNLNKTDAFTFIRTHIEYGRYLGKITKKFIKKNKLKPDFIVSHGHTIFHQPDKKITCQIGDGASISAVCGKPVICDFRSMDVALGGQGAPLVPIGDKLLFPEYDYCLNLGGFANISFDKKNNQRVAFDICPVNSVLNVLANSIGKSYDKDGEIAASGKINNNLLYELNNIPFYKKKPPKSLGKEWLDAEFFPILNKSKISVRDKLRTMCEHIAEQISIAIAHSSFPLEGERGKLLFITGGGAFNKFLISRIKARTNLQVIIPDNLTVKFKEALVFAFLGILRILNKPNCLKSVTGATKDNIGGAVYLVIPDNFIA